MRRAILASSALCLFGCSSLPKLFPKSALHSLHMVRPIATASADFNGDGKADLVVASAASGVVDLLLGNGDGTFKEASKLAAGYSWSALAVGDLNGDVKADIVVAFEGSEGVTGGVLVFPGHGDGTFDSPLRYGAGRTPTAVAIADVNGDHKPDLVVGNNSTGGNVGVLLGHGDCRFDAAAMYTGSDWVTPVNIGAAWWVAVADFNRDGKPDLAIANAAEEDIGLLAGRGDGTFESRVAVKVGYPVQRLAAADVNGDGIADLVVAHSGLSVLLGKGDGTFQHKGDFRVGIGAVSFVLDDFNGDGKVDIATATRGTEQNHDYLFGEVEVLLGDGLGGFAGGEVRAGGEGHFALTAGDFDGDGRPDLAVANYTTNNVGVLLTRATP
jgi:hypothetical protein